MATRDLLVRINGDTSGLEKALGTAADKSGGFSKALDKAKTGSFALLGGLTAAAGGAVFFGLKAKTAYDETQVAQSMLQHAVIGVTHATQAQLQQTMALSDALEKKGVLDGDNIKVGLAQLSTFGLSNKAVQQLGGSLADLAVNQFGVSASGEQLSTTANMIAKALHGQFGVLEKSGIRFTDAQKKIIQFGTEEQKVKAINEGFAQNLKFTNEQARKTAEGGLAHMKVQLGNIQEAAGKFISDALTPLVTGFSNWLDSMGGPDAILKKIGDKLKELQPYLPIIAGAILGGLVPAFIALGAGIWGALAPLLPFLAAGAAIGFLVKKLMDHFGGFSAMMAKIHPIIKAFSMLWSDFLWPALQQVWHAFADRLLPSLQRLWAIVSPILLPVLKVLAIVLGAQLFAGLMIGIKGLQLAIGWLSNIINWIGNVINWVKSLVGWFGRIPSMISRGFGGLKNALLSPFKTAFNAIADLWNNTVGSLHFKLPSWIPKLGGKGFDMPKIPKFAQGVTNFEGGLAYVHQGEMLANLPPGTNVIPKAQVAAAAGPQNVINFNPTLQVGMFAGMPTEYRDIAERLWVEFTRIAKSNGISLSPIGARVQ